MGEGGELGVGICMIKLGLSMPLTGAIELRRVLLQKRSGRGQSLGWIKKLVEVDD
jgi:hypothetical protein